MNILLNRRSAGLLAVVLLVALFTGCVDKKDTATEQTEAPVTLTAEEEALVTKIAAIATALEETPTAASTILEKYSMTVDEYEAEVYKIASSPALSDAFEKVKNR